MVQRARERQNRRSALKLRRAAPPSTQARSMMCGFLSPRLGESRRFQVGTGPGEAFLVVVPEIVVPEIEVPTNRTKRACGAGSIMGLGDLIRSRLLL